MPIDSRYMAMSAEKGGPPAHLIVRMSRYGLKCHCDSTIKCFKNRMVEVTQRQVLTCEKCNEELRKWERFWNRNGVKES